MPEIRTLVTFQSPAFNATERRDYFINDCCYGDDVARWLIEQLRARGVQTDAEPGQEDFGWYFGFRIGDTDYHFVIGHRPSDGGDPAVWIGWLERKAGLFRSMFGRHKRCIRPEGVHAIHSVLSSSPQVSNVSWHHQHDFNAGREDNGQTEPIADMR
jgi:hypothetical protein